MKEEDFFKNPSPEVKKIEKSSDDNVVELGEIAEVNDEDVINKLEEVMRKVIAEYAHNDKLEGIVKKLREIRGSGDATEADRLKSDKISELDNWIDLIKAIEDSGAIEKMRKRLELIREYVEAKG